MLSLCLNINLMGGNFMAEKSKKHRWKFYRYGGLDQVGLESADDLRNLEQLDPKLWAAMTCPTTNIEFDARTLEYLDTDKDSRVKIPEILAAVKWLCSILTKPEAIMQPGEAFPLELINSDNPEGAAILASMKRVLANLGKAEAKQITLADLADTAKIFAVTQFNGDGIITADVPASDAAKQMIEEIISCLGSVEDRSGTPGISQEMLDQLLDDARAYSEWVNQPEKNSEILFAAEETPGMASAYLGVKRQIDDYFTRCQLASYDSRYAQANAALEQEYVALLKKSLSTQTDELKELPLALVNEETLLKMKERVNPAWAQALAAFAEKVAKPLTDQDKNLSEADWQTIKGKFAAYEAWQNDKKGQSVEKLGPERVKELLEGKVAAEIEAMIAQDKALAPEFEALEKADKLVRYYRYLYTLLNNFVAFRDFYDTEKSAVFQLGTLYMDSRSCKLCVRVTDIARHSSMANSCNTFLVYCDCIRQGSAEKMTIAAAFTDGDSEQLLPGRNGLFVDHKGNYWDATIVKIIDYPISIRQAFWNPYKRLGNLIREQLEKFAAAKEKALGDSMAKTVEAAPVAGKPAAAPFDVGKFAGIFAAIGLALAAIGSTVASIIAGFMSLAVWQMPLAIGGVLLLISGPSMIMAAFRLRRRNLGAILDANGWAVNTRAQINIAFGKTLTGMAELPEGAIQSKDDPFPDKRSAWAKVTIALLLLVFVILMWRSAPARNQFKRFLGLKPVVSAEKELNKKPAAKIKKQPAKPQSKAKDSQ